MPIRHPKLLAALAVLPLAACVTTTTSSTTWGEDGSAYAQGEWARPGHVESIRETVQRQQGDPAGGAVAGAMIGGLLGSMVDGPHAVAGAIGGAMVGAASSQGGGEHRSYEVFVRFDDGGRERFVYEDALPFRTGDSVQLTPRGLYPY